MYICHKYVSLFGNDISKFRYLFFNPILSNFLDKKELT